MDEVTWGALALALTILGALWTWRAFRRRGLAPGLRAAAFTLLPPAAWLTDTLQMFTKVVDAVGGWALNLVFDPFVWLGVVLAGMSAVLFVVSGMLRARGLGTRESGSPRGSLGRRGDDPSASTTGRARSDGEFGDIEELLRRRGID